MALHNTIRLTDSFSKGEVLRRMKQIEDDYEYEYNEETDNEEDAEYEEEEEVLINRARV